MVETRKQALQAFIISQALDNFTKRSVGSVRNNFADTIDEVQFFKERIIITEHRKPSAVILPIEAAKIIAICDKLGISDKISNADPEITTTDQLLNIIREGAGDGKHLRNSRLRSKIAEKAFLQRRHIKENNPRPVRAVYPRTNKVVQK